ncbi:MAG: TetR/AcrR family transcriptional regulator [Balneolaceae bacterium]
MTVVQNLTDSQNIVEKISRKERERLARREAIIDSAIYIIKQKGFDKTTMDEIAEDAEIGKGTLYLHFKSKIAIYVAICERGMQQLLAEFETLFDESRTGLGIIQKMGDVYLTFVQKHPYYVNAATYYENLADKEEHASGALIEQCDRHAHHVLELMAKALQTGMDDSTIRSTIDPVETAFLIWASSRGVLQLGYMQKHHNPGRTFVGEQIQLHELTEGFIELISTGLKNQKKES